MADVRRIVLDVLKPHDPSLLAFANHVADVESVAGATVSLIELDTEVQNVQLTIEGESLDFEAIQTAVEDLGGSVHSIDQVASGEYAVTRGRTHQDD